MKEWLKRVFANPWCLAGIMVALFVGAIGMAFAEVLPADVVFLAPDAPLIPLTFQKACAQLFTPAPAVLNLVRLLPFGFAYEGSFWVDMAICCFAALFCLRGYRVSWGAAWVGGFAAAFTGYFATLFCAGHRGVVDALAVSCLAFGLVHRAITRGTWRWFMALGLLMPLALAAQADIWLIMMMGVCAYGAFLIVCECRAKGVKPVAKQLLPGMLCAGLCFGIAGIPALRHTFGVAQETRSTQLAQASASAPSSVTARRTAWRFTTDWSLPPEDSIELLVPAARGHTSYQFDPAPYVGRMGSAHQVLRQHSVHLGWLTLLLAVVALCVKTPTEGKGMRWFWAGLAVVGVLLAFGKYTPLYSLVWELPFINQIRAPVKWLHLTGFACAILAGLGAEAVVKRFGNGLAVVLCCGIALTGVAVIRPFVFPIQLPAVAELQTLPPQTRIYAIHTYHDWLRYYGYEPVQNPRQAQAALLVKPAEKGFELTLIKPELSR
jgi:hypothetical protein